MPTNLELKIQLKSFVKVKRLLSEIGAEFVKELKQKDVYYKVPKMLLKLRIENGEESIIKYNRDEKGKNRFSDYKVIYFKEGGGEDFYKDIFKIEAVVEKKRLLYMYDNTRVHLDKVKGLGYFLEFETLVIKGKDDAKKRFDFIVEALQIDKTQQIKKSYRDLIKQQNKK